MDERKQSEGSSTDFLLGQITAQLREIVHSQNNMNQAVNGLEMSLGKRIDDLSRRVAVLETANARKEGAAGIVAAILKSPALGWLFLGAVTLWAFFTGKVRP